MPDGRREEKPEAGPETSKGLAILAAAPPALFVLAALVIAVVSAEGNVFEAIQTMGFWFYVVTAVTLVSVVATSVLLLLAGRGLRVPSALIALAAVMPWLCGLAGARSGGNMVLDAVEYADASSRATIAAVGLGEALHSQMYGAWMSAALLAAVAVGLGIAAAAQQAPGRRVAAAALGAAALPLLGLAAVALPAGMTAVVLLMLPAVAAVGAGAIAGAATGSDARGRSGALAAAAPVAATTAFVAAASSTLTVSAVQVMSSMAMIEPANRTSIIVIAAGELGPVADAVTWGAVAGLVAVAAGAIYAATRTRPSAGRIAGALALVALTAGVGALDRWASAASIHAFAPIAAPGWSGVEGFEPLAVTGESRGTAIDALVIGDRVVSSSGALLAPAGDRTALARALRTIVERDAGPRPLGGGPREVEVPAFADDEPRPDPVLSVAVDDRVPIAFLRTLIEASAEAGARSLQLHGRHPASASPADRERVARALPFLTPWTEQEGAVEILLPTALPEGYADRDHALLHATIGPRPVANLDARRGTTARSQGSLAYLAIGPDATVGSVAGSLTAVREMGFHPLLTTGEIPGHPDQEAIEVPQGELGLDAATLEELLQQLGDAGVSAPPTDEGTPDDDEAPAIEEGETRVRDLLAPDIIRRVVRRNLPQVRHCYEQALMTNPNLQGRVTVAFTISPTGAVSGASVASSTLGSAPAEACIVAAVRRWRFPAPEGGGSVQVNYPFLLEPE